MWTCWAASHGLGCCGSGFGEKWQSGLIALVLKTRGHKWPRRFKSYLLRQYRHVVRYRTVRILRLLGRKLTLMARYLS